MPAERRHKHFPRNVREGIAGDGDVLDVVPIGSVEAGRGGQIRESGPMFDAVQPLFFDGRDEQAVVEKSRRSVAMEGVESENFHSCAP